MKPVKKIVCVALVTLLSVVVGCGDGGKTETRKPPARSGASNASTAAQAAPSASSAEVTLDPATAGTITVTCKVKGTPPKMKAIDMSKDGVCVGLHTAPVLEDSVVVGEGGSLANVIVYIKDINIKTPVPAEPVVLDQKGCVYVPHVITMRAGQKFVVKNSDATSHNVHIFSKANGTWNQTMNGIGEMTDKQLSNPESQFEFRCDVHPWMKAVAGTFKHDYHTVSGMDGAATLKSVPPGEWTVVASHERFGKKEMKVKVDAKGAATASVEFSDE